MTTKSCIKPINTITMLHYPAGELKYVCETIKKLSMSRVVLRKKATNDSTGDGEGNSESHEPIASDVL